MSDTVTLTIDNQPVTVPKGITILEAAAAIGVEIPTICYHPSLTPPAVCRLCTVEVEGRRNLQPACVVPVAEDMVVRTDSERLLTARKVILELLDSTVDLHDAPEIQPYLQKYGAESGRFAGGVTRRFDVFVDNPFYIRVLDTETPCFMSTYSDKHSLIIILQVIELFILTYLCIQLYYHAQLFNDIYFCIHDVFREPKFGNTYCHHSSQSG